MRTLTILALLASSPVFAQVPGVPAGPTTAAAAAGAATGAPQNIWSRLFPTQEQCDKLKAKLCASPFGQLLGGILTPYRAMTGGLIPQWCPGPLDPLASDLAKPADSAEGAAARIKQSEADAKARRAAVRYLGTVDCKRYPEAEAALLNALRGDPNECVRLEAALAFRNGCCCSKKVIEALIIVVNGEKTEEPAENSPRVKCAAAEALQRCLATYCDVDPPRSPEPPVVEPVVPAPPEPGVPDAARPADELPPPGMANSVINIRIDPLRQRAERALLRYQRPVQTAEPPLAVVREPITLKIPPASGATAGPTIRILPVSPSAQTPPVASITPAQATPALRPVPPLQTIAPRPVPVQAAVAVPPTGKRSLWSLIQHAAGN